MKTDNKKNDDQALMSLYLKGDLAAFEEIYSRYSGKMMAYIRSKISSDQEAQEIFQDSILKFHKHRHSFNDKHPLASWIFTITRNVLYDRLRRLQHETKNVSSDYFARGLGSDFSSSAQSGHGLAHDSSKSAENISEANLSQLEQELIQLRVIDELSYEEIGSKLNITQANARKILSRALKSLRAKLKPR